MPTITISDKGFYNCDGTGCCGGTDWLSLPSLMQSFGCRFCNSYLRNKTLKIKDNRNSGKQLSVISECFLSDTHGK